MTTGDPFDRHWIEVAILSHLNDTKHPVLMHQLRMIVEEDLSKRYIVTCANQLRDDGLVTIREIKGGDHLVTITPQGRAALHMIYSGKTGC
jgi:predicted transcriptional regulator